MNRNILMKNIYDKNFLFFCVQFESAMENNMLRKKNKRPVWIISHFRSEPEVENVTI